MGTVVRSPDMVEEEIEEEEQELRGTPGASLHRGQFRAWEPRAGVRLDT
jgi:hypothetical protein